MKLIAQIDGYNLYKTSDCLVIGPKRRLDKEQHLYFFILMLIFVLAPFYMRGWRRLDWPHPDPRLLLLPPLVYLGDYLYCWQWQVFISPLGMYKKRKNDPGTLIVDVALHQTSRGFEVAIQTEVEMHEYKFKTKRNAERFLQKVQEARKPNVAPESLVL